MRASVLSDWLAQRLDRGNGQPVYRQLHRLLQQAILSKELPRAARCLRRGFSPPNSVSRAIR